MILIACVQCTYKYKIKNNSANDTLNIVLFFHFVIAIKHHGIRREYFNQLENSSIVKESERRRAILYEHSERCECD